MSSEHVNADLRAAFELHRARVLGLKRNCLTRLFEILSISPDTTDLEDLDIISRGEWPTYAYGPSRHPIKTSADLYALTHDGTKPPLPEEERLKLFAEIEAILKERATLDSNPLTLPDDFKQLCTLTNSLQGPALPKTNSQIPDAFDGLHGTLIGLKYPMDSAESLKDLTGLESPEWEVTVILEMGGVEDAIGGGCWLCWCKEDGEDWGWRWVTRVGHDSEPEIYEDVKDLLDRYCETYLSVITGTYDEDIDEGVF
jgi:hypothetical protein